MLQKRLEASSVMKRGRWKTMKSVQRYEKHARVTQDWESYSQAQRDYFVLCASSVGSVLSGNALPPHLPW